MERRGILFVVSAPSGAGKTTLCQQIVSAVPGLKHSVSYTTRRPRPGEQHGREYFFVDEPVFREMAARGEFAEWATVYGNLYGTPKRLLTDMMAAGTDILLDVDTQGAMQIKERFQDAIYIYILPPSLHALRSRLLQRAGDSPDEIERRLKKAREEVWSYRHYDYVIRNEDVKQALKELESVIVTERIRTKRLDPAWLDAEFRPE
jgi:guanylate kinase